MPGADPDRDRGAPPASPPLVVRAGRVLTLDAEARVVAPGQVVVEAGRIARVESPGPVPEGARLVDAGDGIVLPGLVQGHVHLGQTLFRGLAEGRRLLPWLRERIWPLEAAHDDETAHASGRLGALECLLGGTTTIQEIGLGPGAGGLLGAIADSGLRAVAGPCLMDAGEGLPEALRSDPDRALADAVSLGEAFEAAHPRLGFVLNPRFVLSCSDALWRGIRETAAERGWPVHTHALEQRDETLTVRELKGGRDEIEYFDDEGVLDTDLRIAHGVWLEDGHLPRLAGRRFSVVHCPSANLKLGSGIADLRRIRGAGIPVGIGADGAACNNDLDALEELRLAALLQSVRHRPGELSGLGALRLATSEGARAIGLEEEIGSLEPGKAADLLVLATDRPETWADEGADPHDLVAFAASRALVRHVLVDGELLVEDGRPTRLDPAEIRREAERSRAVVLRRSGLG